MNNSSTAPQPSERLPGPSHLIARIIRPFFKTRLPDEAAFRRGLIIGSSTFNNVDRLLARAAEQYPTIQFTVLVDDRNEARVKENWPEMDVRAFHKAIGRQEKLALIRELIHEQYDVCFILGAGDLHYDFLRGMGMVSGAGYIKVYNELLSPFYFMLGQWKAILRHLLWRSKHQPASDIVHVRIPFYRTGVGFLIAFIRVIPMIRSANRLKASKNPFFEE